MNTFEMDSTLFYKNFGMLWRNTLFGLIINVILFATVKSSQAEFYIPAFLLILAMHAAFVFSFPQKELFNGAFTWNIPGLAQRFFKVQLFWISLTMVAGGAYLFFVTLANPIAFASWTVATFISFSCLAALAYILMTMIIFRFEYAAMAHYAPLAGIFLLPKVAALPLHGFLSVMQAPWIFAGVLILMVWALRKMMLKKSLQRSICDRTLLTPSIVNNTSRMQSYKDSKDKKQGGGNFSQRAGGQMLVSLLGKISEAKAKGLNTKSKLWEGLFLYFTIQPRSRWGIIAALLAYPLLVLISGYYADYSSSSMDRWFSSITFVLFAYLPSMLAYSMVEQPLILQSRKTREKAGYQLAAILGIASLALPAVAWFFLKYLEGVMPALVAGGRDLYYLAPEPEIIFSALFALPVILLAVLRFQPGRNKLQMVGVLAFYFLAGITSISREGNEGDLPMEVAVTMASIFLVATTTFILFWKKRCRMWDQ